MRSVSLASDGSCLLAGSVKVGREGGAFVYNEIDMLITIRFPEISGCHYVPSPYQVPHAAASEP